MSQPHDHTTGPPDPARSTDHAGHGGHGGHSWMMIACCVPMLIIAVALVATGVVGSSFLIIALVCTAMMALMMRGMNGSGDKHRKSEQHR